MRGSILLVAALSCSCAQEIAVDRRDAGVRDAGPTTTDSGRLDRDGGPDDERDAGFADPRDGGTRDGGTRDGGITYACLVDPLSVCDDPDEAARTNNDWASASAWKYTLLSKPNRLARMLPGKRRMLVL